MATKRPFAQKRSEHESRVVSGLWFQNEGPSEESEAHVQFFSVLFFMVHRADTLQADNAPHEAMAQHIVDNSVTKIIDYFGDRGKIEAVKSFGELKCQICRWRKHPAAIF